MISAPVEAVETAVDEDAIEYDGLDDGSLRTWNPLALVSVGSSGRGKANGVPLTERIDSLFLGCLRGYVGVLGGSTGLNTVVAGLNCDACLMGDAGRDLEGIISLTGDMTRFEPGCRPGLFGILSPDRVGVLGKRARDLLALGVALVGDRGAIRAVRGSSRISIYRVAIKAGNIRVLAARSSS